MAVNRQMYNELHHNVEPMCQTGAKSVRSHTHKLADLINAPHVTEQIFTRFTGMVKTMQVSENTKLKYLAEHSLSSPGSIMCTNLSFIAKKLKIDSDKVMSQKMYGAMFQLTEADKAAIQTIKDIKCNALDFLSETENDELLNFISCN